MADTAAGAPHMPSVGQVGSRYASSATVVLPTYEFGSNFVDLLKEIDPKLKIRYMGVPGAVF